MAAIYGLYFQSQGAVDIFFTSHVVSDQASADTSAAPVSEGRIKMLRITQHYFMLSKDMRVRRQSEDISDLTRRTRGAHPLLAKINRAALKHLL